MIGCMVGVLNCDCSRVAGGYFAVIGRVTVTSECPNPVSFLLPIVLRSAKVSQSESLVQFVN